MAKIDINRVTNANVYLDGTSFLGRAEEVDLPNIKHKMSQHKALGMVGTIESWSGIEKMEAKFKWSSFYKEVLAKAADPFKAVSVQVRSSLETYSSAGRIAEVPVVVFLTGQFDSIPAGNYKQHDNVEITNGMTVSYCKVVVDGVDVVEFDAFANIYKVKGQDLLSTYRANIGG
ncbi:MAG: phage major tail tube protein [Chromatiaceae bacterium]|nr:phage major tail tube protein [Chromatiaceae bacterium]